MGRCEPCRPYDNDIGRTHFYIGQVASDSATIKTTAGPPRVLHVGLSKGTGIYSPFTEIDFSTQYDINEHSSVFKALNLADAPVVEHGRFDNQLLNVQEIGRTFTMGVRAKL